MEASEAQDPVPVHGLVRRSMKLIETHLGPMAAAHGNQRLHLSNVVALLLACAMEPSVRSLRLIEQHSAGAQVQALTGRRFVPRSTLADALGRFDPEALRPVIAAVYKRLPRLRRFDPDSHLAARQLIAADGSWFNLAGEVVTALKMNRGRGTGKAQSRVRLNLQLDIQRLVPVDLDVSGKGDGSEARAFIRKLQGDCIYVVDRNFVHFGFINAVKARGAQLVLRLKKDVKFAASEDRPCTGRDQAHGVLGDQLGVLCGPTSVTNVGRDSKTGHVPPHVYRRIVVRDRKTQADLILLTDLLEEPAWAVAELYRLRWQIELFLRWLKVFACFDHLISTSPRGITLQFYVAVLLTLLLYLRTGMPVSKHTLHLLALSARGQITPEMTALMLARRAREQLLAAQRKNKKALG